MFTILQSVVASNNESLMMKDGKIYLVMTIASIILIGLFIYVTTIDKKISQLEKIMKD